MTPDNKTKIESIEWWAKKCVCGWHDNETNEEPRPGKEILGICQDLLEEHHAVQVEPSGEQEGK